MILVLKIYIYTSIGQNGVLVNMPIHLQSIDIQQKCHAGQWERIIFLTSNAGTIGWPYTQMNK